MKQRGVTVLGLAAILVLGLAPGQPRADSGLEKRVAALETQVEKMKKDQGNLEHLVVEMADELSVLNVKMAKLQK